MKEHALLSDRLESIFHRPVLGLAVRGSFMSFGWPRILFFCCAGATPIMTERHSRELTIKILSGERLFSARRRLPFRKSSNDVSPFSTNFNDFRTRDFERLVKFTVFVIRKFNQRRKHFRRSKQSDFPTAWISLPFFLAPSLLLLGNVKPWRELTNLLRTLMIFHYFCEVLFFPPSTAVRTFYCAY